MNQAFANVGFSLPFIPSRGDDAVWAAFEEEFAEPRYRAEYDRPGRYHAKAQGLQA